MANLAHIYDSNLALIAQYMFLENRTIALLKMKNAIKPFIFLLKVKYVFYSVKLAKDFNPYKDIMHF